MLDSLLNLLKNQAGIGHLSSILATIEQLVDNVGVDYLKDGNARDAAIDAIVQILQSHKTK